MPEIVIDGKRTATRVFICRVCEGKLRIEQTLPDGSGLFGGHVDYAIEAAALVLGWEQEEPDSPWHRCPAHLDDEVR